MIKLIKVATVFGNYIHYITLSKKCKLCYNILIDKVIALLQLGGIFMAEQFVVSLDNAIDNRDEDAIIALLNSRDCGRISLDIDFYFDILNCSSKKQEKVANAVFRFLLLPTAKGNYPLMKLAKAEIKKNDHFCFIKVLDMIDCVAWSQKAKIEGMLYSLKTKDLKALDFLLNFAGDELAGVIYACCFDENAFLLTEVRDAITLFATYPQFDNRCMPFLEDHNYTLGEIAKLNNFPKNKMLSNTGLFMLLFKKPHIQCNDYTPPKSGITGENMASCMIYLRYLYEKGVPPREWGAIRGLCESTDIPWVVSVLAIKVFATYYPGNTKQILQYLGGVFNALDAEVDEFRTTMFLHTCLRNRKDLFYAAYLALRLRRFGEYEYLDIMLELFDRLDGQDVENPDFIRHALEQALCLRRPNKDFLHAISAPIESTFDIEAGDKFYFKCLGGSAIAVLQAEEGSTMHGVKGIYGYPTMPYKYKVVDFHGSVYKSKKYCIFSMDDDGVQILKLNSTLYLDGNSVLYFRLEDVAKASLNE